MIRVVFLLVPDFHLLDLAGPAQVFGHAAEIGPDYQLRYVAERDLVPSAQGAPVGAQVGWPDLAVDDLIVVPGWRTPRRGNGDPVGPDGLRWLREHHAAGGTVASVCAGAFALGAAGLLDGRRCTTHHELTDTLARRYPSARVVRDVLYVLDGRIVTSAGIARVSTSRCTWWPSGTDRAWPPGWPAPWWCTRGATGTSGRPAPCSGTEVISAMWCTGCRT